MNLELTPGDSARKCESLTDQQIRPNTDYGPSTYNSMTSHSPTKPKKVEIRITPKAK